MEQKIEVRAIIEMLGAPKEHIENILKEYVQKLKEEGKQITSETYEEAVQQGTFFSTFAEIELNMKDTEELLNFCFDNMPSSVEIINPEKIEFGANQLTAFLNDFQAKIHQVDALLKDVSAKQQLLDNNALNILHNFVHYMLKEEDKTIQQLSEKIGVAEKELKSFLEMMIKKGLIKQNGSKYTVAPKT